MTSPLDAFLATPPPRPAAQAEPLVKAAGRGYRSLGRIMWGVVVVVSLMVGMTSAEGERLTTTAYSVIFCSILFAIPTQVFVLHNVAKVRECLLRGERLEATVVKAVDRGNPGRRMTELEVELTHPKTGAPLRAIASGLVPELSPGDSMTALYDPSQPGITALVDAETGVTIARIQ